MSETTNNWIKRRVTLTRLQIVLLTAIWISFLPNIATLRSFWNAPSAGNGLPALAFTFGGWLFVVWITLCLLLLFGLFFWGRGIKVLCAIALVSAACLGYFSWVLGTQFDKSMLINMLQTHNSETLELVNVRFLLWTLFVGILPALMVMRLQLTPSNSPVRSMMFSTAVVVGLLAVCALTVFSMYSKYASASRNRDISFHTLAPANIVGAGLAHFYAQRAASSVREVRGEDAHQSYAIEKPRLFIFVLGETARAQNHTLNGYARDTTPRMVASGGYYFPNTESCGTATAISVPCMFSGYSRKEFSLAKGRSAETLFDVIGKSGARMIWRDNDSGCKGVCDKTEFEDFTNAVDPKWCLEESNCFDEILLEGLESKIRAVAKDTLVVLHLKGSHGPAYYKRYPKKFEKFSPTCQTNDLAACDTASLVNSYDNTIVYTDHVIGEVIKTAENLSDQFATAVLYVSDHGESLGESGLFLHGMPYAIAPKEQTRVPMYAWVSPQFIKMERWDAGCMARQTRTQRSHDNVYSTVLGFMEIDTSAYKRELDLFEPCDEETDGIYKGRPKVP
jgi:lipid A ethanolaminephosphotransferase